jgi:uncharacterized protein (TIGR00266 family)
MQIKIIKGPGNPAAEIELAANECVTTEGGSMMAMTDGLTISTDTRQKSKGGMLSGLKRLVSGESYFLNHFRAGSSGGKLWLASTLPGDLCVLQVSGLNLVAEGGSYLASEEGVQIDSSWQGFKNLLSGEGLFWLRVTGEGQIVLSSFGAIFMVEVDGEYVVDTGHIVAFEETLNFEVVKAAKSLIGSFLGGEGFVCRFSGKGKLWIQSHHAPAFGKLLGPLLKPR